MSTEDQKYTRNAGVVFSLKYHIVWCPKYRLKVLVPPVDERLKVLLGEVSAEHGFVIHKLKVMPDHIYMLVESPPHMSVSDLANKMKGATSRFLRQEFPHLKSRMPTLWSRSYYAGTVGAVSDTAVRRYIGNQKTRKADNP